MDDLFGCIAIIVAATSIAAVLLTIAFDIPAMITSIFVMAVIAGCIEYYVRSVPNK